MQQRQQCQMKHNAHSAKCYKVPNHLNANYQRLMCLSAKWNANLINATQCQMQHNANSSKCNIMPNNLNANYQSVSVLDTT